MASTAVKAPRVTYGRGCFAPRQSSSFAGTMDLVHQAPNFTLSGAVTGAPMNKSTLFGLVGTRNLATPMSMGPSGCLLYLDPTGMIVVGPVTMDLRGAYTWSALGTLKFDPVLAGQEIYGQFAAVNSDWLDNNIYLSNGVKLQFPLAWSPNKGPAVTTIHAAGVGATTAVSGTVKRNYGLVITVGP